MQKKLRLLTVASLATSARVLPYDRLRQELALSSVRDLEDLIIEGTNADVVHGKLDQKSSHFEVYYSMPRDIRKVVVSNVPAQSKYSTYTIFIARPSFTD